MITSVNSNNSHEYGGLFGDATLDLRAYAKDLLEKQEYEVLRLFINRFPDGKDYNEENIENLTAELIDKIVKISTLNNYFCNIKELIRETGKIEYSVTQDTIVNDKKVYYIYNFENSSYQQFEGNTFEPNVIYYEKKYKPNPKYAALSLNEPRFAINADTRNINVPAEFKKNGLGVQGDHTAETIYFEIDRYFDTIDLAADDIFIAIQYEGANKDIHGLDSAVFKDVTALQDKIVFGWVIDNKITAMPGTIKFAVHFFKGELDENDRIKAVSYSFNTLPASININKAFEFDFESFDTQRDPSQLVIDRLTNSKADGEVDAMAPEFVINLPTGKIDLDDPDGVDEKVETYTLNALGHSPDAGAIDYIWYRRDGDEVAEIPGKMDYILTKDEVPKKNKFYYYIVDNEHVRFRGDEFIVNEKYYERRSFCEVDRVGTYFVVIRNTVGTSYYDLESNKVEVPRPTMPSAEKITLEVYDNDLRYGYDAEVGYIRATREFGTEETLKISALPNDEDNESLSFQWYKLKNMTEQDKEAPKELNFEDAELIAGAVENEYVPEETGWYTVNLIGERNGATVEFPSGKYYRLTTTPDFPVIIDDGKIEEDIFLSRGENVVIELKDLGCSDEVVYKWYKDVEPYGMGMDQNDVLLNFPKDASTISNAELYNYVGDVLYCVPVNIYNKVEVTGLPSRRFFIMKSVADSPDFELPKFEEEEE